MIAVGIAGATGGCGRPAAAQPSAPGIFVVKDVRIFDGETIHERSSVLVRGGRIAAVGPGLAVPPAR